MISLQLRSCSGVTDDGIIDMCENFSGAAEIRKAASEEDGGCQVPENDTQRYKALYKCDLKATLKHLNLGDIKNLTNRSMKSISVNLMINLSELCIWGDYNINNDGILDLCMANRQSKFQRINYCGCYKVSDDARLWFSTSFVKSILNYIRIEDFGQHIDYDSYIDIKKMEVISPKEEEEKL